MSLFRTLQAVIQLGIVLLEVLVQQGQHLVVLAQKVEHLFLLAIHQQLPDGGISVGGDTAQSQPPSGVGEGDVLAAFCLQVSHLQLEGAVAAVLAVAEGERITDTRTIGCRKDAFVVKLLPAPQGGVIIRLGLAEDKRNVRRSSTSLPSDSLLNSSAFSESGLKTTYITCPLPSTASVRMPSSNSRIQSLRTSLHV